MSTRPAQAVRFKGRSFFALTITPEAPLADWLGRLDGWLERSPSFFHRNAVILDVTGLEIGRSDLVQLVGDLAGRAIRILGVEGAPEEWASADLPPFLSGGREPKPASKPASQPESRDEPARAPDVVSAAEPAQRQPPLVVSQPIRSGQCVTYPEGDVIVLGAVGSGAEVVAGGSIHVYGALRGRAMAGAYGDETARIFCRALEAELIAINGLYQTAEEFEEPLRRKPAMVWLDGGNMHVAKLD